VACTELSTVWVKAMLCFVVEPLRVADTVPGPSVSASWGNAMGVDPRIKDFYSGGTKNPRVAIFAYTEFFWGSVCDGRGSLPVPLLKDGCIVCVLWRAVLISVSNISGLINKEAVFFNGICWCFLRCLHPPPPPIFSE
jgi:hypothetical protein